MLGGWLAWGIEADPCYLSRKKKPVVFICWLNGATPDQRPNIYFSKLPSTPTSFWHFLKIFYHRVINGETFDKFECKYFDISSLWNNVRQLIPRGLKLKLTAFIYLFIFKTFGMLRSKVEREAGQPTAWLSSLDPWFHISFYLFLTPFLLMFCWFNIFIMTQSSLLLQKPEGT